MSKATVSTMTPGPAPAVKQFLAGITKRTWIGLALAVGLWWIFMYFTRWPSVQGKSEILNVLAAGAPNTFSELVSREGWPYWLSWIPTGINMNDNNAIGMAFAFLIGGAVTALVLPQRVIDSVLHSRGVRGASFGGLLGAPLMMCSACSIPVAVGWKQRGANLETTLGVVVGASLMNVMGLVTIWLLFPGPAHWARLVASLFMVLAVTPLVARLTRDKMPLAAALPAPPPTAPECALPEAAPSESWGQAALGALKSWWWASVTIAYRLFIPMTSAIFLAAFIRLFVPAPVVESYLGGGPGAVALAALFGCLIAIPTMFEIPMAIGFVFLGMGMGPATALIIAAPSVSVVSYFMLRKDVGSRPPLLLMAATFVTAFTAGMIVDFIG